MSIAWVVISVLRLVSCEASYRISLICESMDVSVVAQDDSSGFDYDLIVIGSGGGAFAAAIRARTSAHGC